MVDYTAHPAAELFPMLDEKRLSELAEDIRSHGLREPIRLYRGQILDGRNRYQACLRVGVDPVFEAWDGGDPYLYVWSLNGERRDIGDQQRYLIWRDAMAHSEAWQAECQRIADEANARRSEAAKARPRGEDGTLKAAPVVDHYDPPLDEAIDQKPKHKTREAKARAAKTTPATVARMDQLVESRPDLAEKVKVGEMKPAEAMRQMKRGQVEQRVAALPAGKYRVIYADPPWQYRDQKAVDGYTGTAASNHYPTMPTTEICALDVRSIAATDSVLFCWATFPMLPDAMEVIRAWGFTYKTAIVWDKERPNFGNYHDASAELLLIATRGSCTPDASEREKQVQRIERTGRHSAKPEAFREIIDRLYPHGPRIEMFRRGDAPDGWAVWGNEAHAA